MAYISPREARSLLARSPVSLAVLAAVAGCSASLLYRATSGQRTLTPRVALRLALALENLSTRCVTLAADLRMSATDDPNAPSLYDSDNHRPRSEAELAAYYSRTTHEPAR